MSMEPNLETLVNTFNPSNTQNAQGAQLANTIYLNPNKIPTSPKKNFNNIFNWLRHNIIISRGLHKFMVCKAPTLIQQNLVRQFKHNRPY
jgi:hypothetical protein